MDVAGVALGAIPILLEILKAYRTAYEAIRTCQSYPEDFEYLVNDFQVCRENFEAICRRVLSAVVSTPDAIHELLKDLDHPHWGDEKLDGAFRNLLSSESYETFKGSASSLRTSIKGTAQHLSRLSSPTIINRGRFVLNKSAIQSKINQTRFSVSSLNEWISHHFRPRNISAASAISLGIPSSDYVMISQASRELHRALFETWKCSDRSHTDHFAKLWLRPSHNSSDQCIDLRLAILYQAYFEKSPVWLMIKSESLPERQQQNTIAVQGVIYGPCVEQRNGTTEKKFRINRHKLKHMRNPFKKQTIEGQNEIHGEHFHESPSIVSIVQETPRTEHNQHERQDETELFPVNDQNRDLCAYLREGPRDHGNNSNFYGQLNVEEGKFKHLVYLLREQEFSGGGDDTKISMDKSIKDLIDSTQEHQIAITCKLKLALDMAHAVLFYSSTPWLKRTWGLRDISIFGSTLSERTIKTLHLSTSMGDETQALNSANIQEVHLHVQEADDDSRINQDTQNDCLLSLGLAFLEVDHWKSLQEMKEEDNTSETQAVFRVAGGVSKIGPRFGKITAACLRGHFGVPGNDTQYRLFVDAICYNVLQPLQEMIKVLS